MDLYDPGGLVLRSSIVRRLMWSGLLAGLGAAASLVTQRLAAYIWERTFGEEPPE